MEINMKRITNFTIFLSLFFIGSAYAYNTENDTVIEEKIQEYKVLRNVANENYVLLENTQTGEYYDTPKRYSGCKFWEETKTGTVLQLKEISRKANWGNYKELNGIDIDICVPFYQSRNQ